MLDAVVGAVIMVVATTSLLYSIELAEQAFDQAGRYPLNKDEKEVLRKVGVGSDAQAESVLAREHQSGTPRGGAG